MAEGQARECLLGHEVADCQAKGADGVIQPHRPQPASESRPLHDVAPQSNVVWARTWAIVSGLVPAIVEDAVAEYLVVTSATKQAVGTATAAVYMSHGFSSGAEKRCNADGRGQQAGSRRLGRAGRS